MPRAFSIIFSIATMDGTNSTRNTNLLFDNDFAINCSFCCCCLFVYSEANNPTEYLTDFVHDWLALHHIFTSECCLKNIVLFVWVSACIALTTNESHGKKHFSDYHWLFVCKHNETLFAALTVINEINWMQATSVFIISQHPPEYTAYTLFIRDTR